ncbi:unnamed protein product, partial [Iphiclides podalirius]
MNVTEHEVTFASTLSASTAGLGSDLVTFDRRAANALIDKPWDGASDGFFRNVWTLDGVINIKLPSQARVKITTEEELVSLIAKFPMDSPSYSGAPSAHIKAASHGVKKLCKHRKPPLVYKAWWAVVSKLLWWLVAMRPRRLVGL